jgi:ABC-type oligopeptide transport system ATPase subunit
MNSPENLLEIRDLHVEYRVRKGVLGKPEVVRAVNGVSLEVRKGEILAIAGESGCGKSTLARAIIHLETPKSGGIYFNGEDTLKMSKTRLKTFRKHAQMVFQNPYSSLDPKMKIIDTLKEPLQINTKTDNAGIEEIVREKIKLAGLDESCLNNYPHEFSGGQRQRIAIARALVLNPEFIAADEPVSALDVSIQAQIINLIKQLKDEHGITFIFISHDLSVIRHIADRTAIMYRGEIVEIGATEEIFENPQHPYTKVLLNSIPKIGNH